jgi:hypothetical protein
MIQWRRCLVSAASPYPTKCACRLTSIAGYTGEYAEYTDQGVSNEPGSPEETSAEGLDSNLPVGVIMVVGVIVGGVVAIALLFGALLLLRWRAQRKSRARQDTPDLQYKHEGIWSLVEMSGQPKALMLMDSSVHEVDGNSRASELSTPSPSYTKAELPGK